MAEYAKVQFQEGMAGEPAVDTAMEEARAEANPQEESTEAPGSLEIPQPEDSGIDNVLEKFDGDINKMAEAYRELERKQSAAPQETPEAPKTESLESIQPYIEEFQETGQLSEASRKALEQQFPAELIDDYMAKSAQANQWQQQEAEGQLKAIYDAVGGEKGYTDIVTWASENLSPAALEAYNESVTNGTYEQANLAVQGLAAQYTQAVGSAPQLLQSKPAGTPGAAPYESLAQLTEDMKRPEYKSDPAFRNKVQARLARSNVM